MEMVKYIQGMFISWDINMYCRETNTPAYVQTSTLNEELGQIQVIFQIFKISLFFRIRQELLRKTI